MEPITIIRSKTVVLPYDDIDTDQIIPARFLTTTTRNGLGKHLFADWRFDGAGRETSDFVLNQPQAQNAAVLVAGRNFGCGSSREHAPWALLDYGIRAVVSTEIADIFRNNSLKNGLLPIIVGKDAHEWLLAHPGAQVCIDLERTVLELPEHEPVPFPIDRFSRHCLLNGFDQLGYLMDHEGDISRFEDRKA